ncbi:MAG TPA: substrate-binding domain-containing protein [Pirellulales bacterium]|jgi:ribose transport system substrate-binding protein|nr:substrate-binding domain-containing protein [Pirellulales bacterium]
MPADRRAVAVAADAAGGADRRGIEIESDCVWGVVVPYRLLAWLSLIALIGCQPAANRPAPAAAKGGEKTYRIAVVPKGTSHEFWKSVHFGAEQAAAEAGNVEVLWKGPLLEHDRDKQISVVEDFITNQVDGICLAPLDSQSLITPVEHAKEAGIPTVIFDSALDDESIVVSYVATDNRRGGELAAQTLGKSLNGKGDVVLLRYNPGSESTLEREDGFLETLAKEFPGINVLSSEQYAGTTPEEALRVSQQVLLKHGDELDGIFAVCEPNSTGVLGALKNEGLAGKVKFIAFDPNPPLIESLAEGEVTGIVLQDPIRMGYLAVKTLVDHLNGKQVEKRIPTGEFVATRKNMREPEMAKLLHPKQFGE